MGINTKHSVLKKLREFNKQAFQPMPPAPGGQPPMDPAMAAAGGMPPPMDPAMAAAGGMPPPPGAPAGGGMEEQLVMALEEIAGALAQMDQRVAMLEQALMAPAAPPMGGAPMPPAGM